jgi:hypothetical protein
MGEASGVQASVPSRARSTSRAVARRAGPLASSLSFRAEIRRLRARSTPWVISPARSRTPLARPWSHPEERGIPGWEPDTSGRAGSGPVRPERLVGRGHDRGEGHAGFDEAGNQAKHRVGARQGSGGGRQGSHRRCSGSQRDRDETGRHKVEFVAAGHRVAGALLGQGRPMHGWRDLFTGARPSPSGLNSVSCGRERRRRPGRGILC